jgi:ferredoxin
VVKRKIIKIDESLCDGCALCIPSCPEGALQIVNGKAKLVKENFCDGLGACLGDCPQHALSVLEAESVEYDESSVIQHLKINSPEKLEAHKAHLQKHAAEFQTLLIQQHSFCPSSRLVEWKSPENNIETTQSQLQQWPIQLHLVPPNARFFQESDFILVADCVPFAYGNFHRDFLSDHTIAIACPKLDDATPYLDKLTDIIQNSKLKSLSVLVMEVPCCSGLIRLAKEAVKRSGLLLSVKVVTIGIKGSVLGSYSLTY